MRTVIIPNSYFIMCYWCNVETVVVSHKQCRDTRLRTWCSVPQVQAVTQVNGETVTQLCPSSVFDVSSLSLHDLLSWWRHNEKITHLPITDNVAGAPSSSFPAVSDRVDVITASIKVRLNEMQPDVPVCKEEEEWGRVMRKTGLYHQGGRCWENET